MRQAIFFLLTSLIGVACGAPDSPPETALADYVAQPDSTFEWRVQARYSEPRAEIVRLYLQSQTWYSLEASTLPDQAALGRPGGSSGIARDWRRAMARN